MDNIKISQSTYNVIREVVRAICGGLSICLGVIASKMCPFPILAPLLFAVGIFMVMQFDFHLITRHVPTKPFFSWLTLMILVVNLISAGALGLLFDLSVIPPDNLFWLSVAGGIVIGLVSINNLTLTPYKMAIALLLMYIFVMLGLPHCVVYAFLGVNFSDLLLVILGNIVGGLILKIIFSIVFSKKIKSYKK